MNTLPIADLDHILDHTRDLWDELRGERVFLTGGTGFFGKWLLESLLWANDRLGLKCRTTVLTRNPERFIAESSHLARHQAVSLIHGDVRSFSFPSGSFSHIIHAATESSEKLNLQNPILMLDTIVDGTRHTLDFAQSCSARKFLLTSSGAVYGKQPVDITHLPEDYMGAPSPLDPTSAYGEGKRLAEYLCSVYANSTLAIKIARGFAFVGPHLPLHIHFAIGNFIRDALHGGPVTIKGDGTPRRSFLYMADLAIWLWTILIRGEPLRPYNVGSAESLTITEVATRVAELFQPTLHIEIHKIPNPQKPTEQYVPDVSRANKELGLQQHIGIQDSVARTLDWCRSTGNL